MPRRRYHNNTGFLDVLFNTLLGFVLLFVVAFLAIKAESKKGDINTKAEYVISVTWNNDSADDVDTWLLDPLGNILFFKQKDIGMAHLDRDDLGKITDKIITPDGRTIEYIYNQELTTIRGFIEGEWVLNLHMYKKRDPQPTKVEVRLDKLNPVAQTLLHKEIILNNDGKEVTVTRFTMNSKGDIVGWDDLPKGLLAMRSLPRNMF